MKVELDIREVPSSSNILWLFSQDENGLPPDQQEEEPIPETRIEVEIPKVNTDLGNDLYFVKLPNFLSVEPRYGNQLKC